LAQAPRHPRALCARSTGRRHARRMPRARRSAAAARRSLPAAAARGPTNRTSLRSLIEAKPFTPRTEVSPSRLDGSARPFVPRREAHGRLPDALRSRPGSASASTTASGCSSPRSVGDQEAATFRANVFPVPLREKNTFLDFDVPEASPLVYIRSAKSAPDLLVAVLTENEAATFATSRRPCWADLLDDDAAAQTPPPPSAGSAGHELGDCKPCAFVHKPRGCSLAAGCPFCHLCESGEKRRRQKEKKAAFARHP